MPLHTPLFDWHVAHGARMVEFGGWDMPVQYTSIVEEHQLVRKSVGLFDISHMGRLSFGGPDSLDLIQHVYTNNAEIMQDGQVRYGLICNAAGGVLDDVLVYRWPHGYAMVVNAGNRGKIVNWLARHKDDRVVEVRDQTLDTCMIAVQGPEAMTLCKGLTTAEPGRLHYYFAIPTQYRGKPCVVSRTGYTGEDGVEIMVTASLGVELWQELIGRGGKPCGLGARDTLRLEAGMPLYGHELNEETDPLQAGLGWAVKMDKGDFIGREALTRRRQDSSLRRRVGLELEGRRIARDGAPVLRDRKEIGLVTSGTFSPTLDRSIAMAYLDVMHTQPGTECEVDVRGNSVKAKVVALPFYRRPKT